MSQTETTYIPTERVLRVNPRVAWEDEGGKHTVQIDGSAIVGSAQEAQVVIADRAVSRLHAELDARPDGVWVRDLGSKNGTYIDGVRVGLGRCTERTRIRVGKTELTVSFADQPTEIRLWPADHFGPLVARSEAMRELFARMAKIAQADAPVFIQGETGTGKELVARAIHEASSRSEQPYVIVDCAALPENLLETELFGHAKGAFTGAMNSRAGAFEAAEGGTVFLDEIGELPLTMQPKLLRVLESKMVRRVGENQYKKVDVRFICATHRDLRMMVGSGAFREDLYFRVSVLPLSIPSLRDRREDIPLLAEHFLPRGKTLDPDTVQEVLTRPWLGNVRELRNFIDRFVALGAEEALAMGGMPGGPSVGGSLGDLPPVPLDVPFKELRERWVDYLEREYVKGLLELERGNISAVAARAQLDRTYVHRLVKKHDL